MKKKRNHSRKNPPPKSGRDNSLVSWRQSRWPVVRFSLIFVLLMALYYGLALTPWLDRVVFPAYLNMNAQLSSSILNAMGEQSEVSGIIVRSPKFKMAIRRGCDAVEPSWLFCAVVLAFPAPFSRKIVGMVAGIFFMQALNLVRIISLYFIGIHSPSFFNTMHLEIWPILFILAALILWVIWIKYARP